MRIVDHHATATAAEVFQGFGQKYFAVETLKPRIALEKQHVRITENR
jgi:hypothetical protein